MIITLKGANFNNINIGNIYRWNVQYLIGKGATYFGETSVQKDGAFSAIVSITEGYSISDGGVSVTMNGLLLNNVTTIVSNQIAIEIPVVTGPVVITVLTEATIHNLLDLSTMSSTLRYSPGGYNIVGSNGTKYGLFIIQLEPNSTYNLKISSGYTGGLFNAKPVKGSKTTEAYNLNGGGAATHVITTSTDYYWLALNIATNEASNESTALTPTTVWQNAFLYKV
jgi:hypothetical protein